MLTISKGDIVAHYKRYRSLPKELSRTPNLHLYRTEDVVPNLTTNETTVIYRALYDDKVWTRTVANFLSFVPEAGRYRFEKWEGQVFASLGSCMKDGLPLWEEKEDTK